MGTFQRPAHRLALAHALIDEVVTQILKMFAKSLHMVAGSRFDGSPAAHLGVLGVTGLTAYAGLLVVEALTKEHQGRWA